MWRTFSHVQHSQHHQNKRSSGAHDHVASIGYQLLRLSLALMSSHPSHHLDSDLSIRTHISKTVSACFAVLHQIRSIRRSVTRPVTRHTTHDTTHSDCYQTHDMYVHWCCMSHSTCMYVDTKHHTACTTLSVTHTWRAGWAKKNRPFFKCITPIYDVVGRHLIYHNVQLFIRSKTDILNIVLSK